MKKRLLPFILILALLFSVCSLSAGATSQYATSANLVKMPLGAMMPKQKPLLFLEQEKQMCYRGRTFLLTI